MGGGLMAICLEHQAVYVRRSGHVLSWRAYALIYVALLVVVGLEVRKRLCITSLGYELHSQKQAGLELDKERQDLEYQLSVLTTHENLRVESRNRIGLGEVSSDQMLLVESGRR
jgi:hypothetical protein